MFQIHHNQVCQKIIATLIENLFCNQMKKINKISKFQQAIFCLTQITPRINTAYKHNERLHNKATKSVVTEKHFKQDILQILSSEFEESIRKQRPFTINFCFTAPVQKLFLNPSPALSNKWNPSQYVSTGSFNLNKSMTSFRESNTLSRRSSPFNLGFNSRLEFR